MVTSLPTRASVLAATNPKRGWTPSKPLSEATSLSGPLISRFDIVLVLADARNPEWDQAVSQHVLMAHQYVRGGGRREGGHTQHRVGRGSVPARVDGSSACKTGGGVRWASSGRTCSWSTNMWMGGGGFQ